MRTAIPLRVQHGPLTVYLRALEGCPDLQPIIHALPAQSPVIWFDSARCHPVTGRWSMVGYDPWLTLIAEGDFVELRTSAATQRWRANPLDILRQALKRYHMPMLAQPHARPACAAAPLYSSLGAAGRALGLMGLLSYELNRWIERLPEPQSSSRSCPDMLWFGMRVVILIDHLQQRSWVVSVADPHLPARLAQHEAREALERATEQLQAQTVIDPSDTSLPAPRRVQMDGVRATSTQAEFEHMAAQALDYIRAGEIFQANVAQRFTTEWPAEALPLYDVLRRINPAPFACFLSTEELSVVSCSPERLVRVQERRVETRPIAGTRPRGATPQDDVMNSLDLLMSEKERAEHIMLVDLERNDLGRVCVPGSVTVDELMALESYSHVIHIVSNVSGALQPGVDTVDVIRALFPGGTITGCPKVRCMQILRELEPVPRGVYTGSLGYLGFDGTMDLNIAIRTMVLQGGQLSFHVGAGIVADSDPACEYDETLAKAGALMSALQITRDASKGADAIAR